MNKAFKLKEYKTTNFEKSLKNVHTDINMSFLPLIHKVDSIKTSNNPSALDYLDSGFISPIPCDVFDEELVYTFIGRPSYLELNLPTCFVIKPEPELIQNVFIFDSGAYYDNRYSKIIDNLLDINLFRIPANIEMIKRFITLYFGDNTFYYFGLSKSLNQIDIKNSLEEFDFLMLQQIMDFNRAHFDSRCRTLENIIRSPINLDKYLQAIILPKSLSNDETFKYFLDNTNAKFEVMTYNDNNGITTKNVCNQQIDCILLNYYKMKGYIMV